jgi:(p)ppGpp synthase/HD superfamily hydrolase
MSITTELSGATATLEDAILLAATKHIGQVDKAGAMYILHPLRVMFRLNTEEERIAGVLHDVVEDCSVTLEQLLQARYSDAVVEAVDFLSKRPDEEDDYDAFIRRIAAGPELARRVKIADLEDNMDPSRMPHPAERDLQRLEKYGRAIEVLRSSLA